MNKDIQLMVTMLRVTSNISAVIISLLLHACAGAHGCDDVTCTVGREMPVAHDVNAFDVGGGILEQELRPVDENTIPVIIYVSTIHHQDGLNASSKVRSDGDQLSDVERLEDAIYDAAEHLDDHKIIPYVSGIVIADYERDVNFSMLLAGDYNDFRDVSDNWAIHVFAVDKIVNDTTGIEYGGFYFYFSDDACDAIMVINRSIDSLVVTHEFGHAFGLGHTNDEANIMSTGDIDDDATFTTAQADIMRMRSAKLLCVCAGIEHMCLPEVPVP